MPQQSESIKVFYSYSHKDERLRNKLDNHLSLLERQGIISEWHDRMIEAGEDWESEINENLNDARIILLLVSDDFIASDYCYSLEMERALERHRNEEALAVPIILRPVDWESSPLGKLQALPKDGKPVTEWKNRDSAFKNIAQGIRRKIKNFKPKQPQRAISSYIPRPPIIGFVARRDAEGRDIVERLQEELAPGKNQLVTLSGPGGVGKTTLAAEAARILEKTYQGRFVWSDVNARASFTLSTLLDDIATQLGQPALRKLSVEDKESQVRALVTAPPALVALDNYETIQQPERQAIETWFERTRCSTLITSRQTINKTRNIAIQAMSPDEAEEFLNRLVKETQDAEIFSGDVRQRIYKTAEANPFVMEWIVAQIDAAQEPDIVLEELKQGEGDAAERVFDRSFNLPQLGEDGRAALLALALFTPSATREALAEVAGFGNDMKRVNEAISTLRALWLIKGIDQNHRFTVEGLTRTLAGARLSKDNRAPEFKKRFIKYFQDYAKHHEQPIPGDYDLLEMEKDNLLKAMDMSFHSGDFPSLIAMARILGNAVKGVLNIRGYWNELIWCGEKARTAAQQIGNKYTVAAFEDSIAITLMNLGKYDEARLGELRALETFRSLKNDVKIASTLNELANIAFKQRKFAEAKRLYAKALKIDRKIGSQEGIAIRIWGLGIVALEKKKYLEAKNLFEESLKVFRDLQDNINIAGVLIQLGMLAQDQEELEEARRLYDESLEINNKLGNKRGIAAALNHLGRLAEKQKDLVEAERLYQEAMNIYKQLGSPYAEKASTSLERIRSQS